MPTLAQPEAYIGNAAMLFDDKGGIAKPETRDFLVSFLKAFEEWIARFVK